MVSVKRVALAYNNVYLVQDHGEQVLVDTGPDYRGAIEALEAVGPVDTVVATHGHLDHAGLGRWWQGRGTPVAIGAADERLTREPHFTNALEMEAFVRYIEDSGAPRDVAAEVRTGLAARRQWAAAAATAAEHLPSRPTDRWPTALRFPPFAPTRVLADGDEVGAGLCVVACPGHTPGNLVLVHESEGLLFSGDQLLPDIAPTPGVQFVPAEGDWQRFPSLPAFTASLTRLSRMSFTTCNPGHGEPMDDVAGVIAENLAQIEQRTERLFGALQHRGEGRVHDLAEEIYPRALRRRWWQIAATVQGHLDLLVARGHATIEGGRYRAG